MDTRTFFCVVYAGSSIPFEVSVRLDVTVNGLKKAIKDEMDLRDVAAPSLVLWQVSFYSWDRNLCFH